MTWGAVALAVAGHELAGDVGHHGQGYIGVLYQLVILIQHAQVIQELLHDLFAGAFCHGLLHIVADTLAP